MRCRSQRFLRYFVFVGLFVIFAFHFKSSSKEIFASDVSVRDGRRLFGDVSDEISVDFRNLLPRDKRLLSKVKQMIERPEKGDYNLTNPDVEDFSRGQSSKIDILLKQKKNGFFIEIGASDGETGSVSLFFERNRGWDGLLIEPHPGHYRQLRHRQRKASTLRACIRSNSSASKAFVDEIEGHVITPCLWMESILEAMGKKTVDLLSLDAKDQEMDILQAIPFSNYSINVITVEFVEGSGSDMKVMKFLINHGYHANHQFVNHPLHRNDMVFTKEKQV